MDRLDRPGNGRGDVHRRLVGLECDQRVLDGDLVAGRYEDLDYGDLVEVADVGYLNRLHLRSRAHTVVGIGAAGSSS